MWCDAWSDVRQGFRALGRNRGFAAAAILMLSLSIGANTAIFSIVDAVLLRPLPYFEPQRLIMLWSDIAGQGAREETTSYANIEDWRIRNRVFEDLAAFDPVTSTLAGQAADDDPERVSVARVSWNFFKALGVAPAMGRTISAEDEQQRARVAVLSHAFWQRRFGGAASILDQTVLLDGAPSRIIGVMPADFAFPGNGTAAWEPLTLFPDWDGRRAQRGTGAWRVFGRLRTGIEPASAQQDMNRIAGELSQEHPANAGLGVNVVPLHLQLTGRDLRLALWVLMFAVGLVLLIACSNVANLLLARTAARRHELAVRSSLGASRSRLVRQFLAESLVMAGIGAAGGLLVARISVDAILALAASRMPRLTEVTLDGRAVAFTILVSLAAIALFGILPGLRAARIDAASVLAAGTRTIRSRSERRTHGLLVVFQFALSMMLLCGAGLLVRSLAQLQSVDLGFRYDRVLFTTLAAPSSSNNSQRTSFFSQVLDRIRAIPGVEQAGLIENHFISSSPATRLSIEGNDEGTAAVSHEIDPDSVDAGYFQTMAVPVLAGAVFTGQELPDSPPAAVINDAMARRFWPGRNPVGLRFKLAAAQSARPWIIVIGVTGDMRRQSLERDPIPQVFFDYSRDPSRSMDIVIRTAGDPLLSVPAVREAIRSVARTVPLNPIVPLETRLDRWLEQPRFQTALLSIFSAVALILAAGGIYGLMSYGVAQRSQEIGIRMALGASAGSVLKMILRQGLQFALCGLAAGLAAAWLLAQVFAGLLYEVTPHDPATFVAVPAVLIVVAVVACYIPARRAARIDPIATLR